MRIYFWDGSEFKKTAAPCCELHFMGWRIKLLLIGRNKNTLFYRERKALAKIKNEEGVSLNPPQ